MALELVAQMRTSSIQDVWRIQRDMSKHLVICSTREWTKCKGRGEKEDLKKVVA